MQRWIITLLLVIPCFMLSSCTHFLKPYRPPVQQGNIITDDMIKKLHHGMTKQQVADVFGEPVLNNPFNLDTWSYVYTYQPSRGKTQKQHLTVYFQNNRVSNYVVDLPAPAKTKPMHHSR